MKLILLRKVVFTLIISFSLVSFIYLQINHETYQEIDVISKIESQTTEIFEKSEKKVEKISLVKLIGIQLIKVLVIKK